MESGFLLLIYISDTMQTITVEPMRLNCDLGAASSPFFISHPSPTEDGQKNLNCNLGAASYLFICCGDNVKRCSQD